MNNRRPGRCLQFQGVRELPVFQVLWSLIDHLPFYWSHFRLSGWCLRCLLQCSFNRFSILPDRQTRRFPDDYDTGNRTKNAQQLAKEYGQNDSARQIANQQRVVVNKFGVDAIWDRYLYDMAGSWRGLGAVSIFVLNEGQSKR